ncbi:MAG: hypothetical protein ACK4ST_08480 [Elioraea tepidiphila]
MSTEITEARALAEALVRIAPTAPRREARPSTGLDPGLAALFQ